MKKFILSLVVLLMVASSSAAFADPGFSRPEFPGRGIPNRGFPGRGLPNRNVPPPAPAVGGFAAIAYDQLTGHWGEYHGAFDINTAEDNALAACGSADCKIVNWVQNGYIAIAVGEGNHFGSSGVHNTAEDAADSALENCQRVTVDCVIKTQTAAFQEN